jgi:hypothetical protein
MEADLLTVSLLLSSVLWGKSGVDPSRGIGGGDNNALDAVPSTGKGDAALGCLPSTGNGDEVSFGPSFG